MTADSVGKSYRSIEEVRETVYQGELRTILAGERLGLISAGDAEERRALAKANRGTISPEEREAFNFDEIAHHADTAWIKARVRDIREPIDNSGLVVGPFYDYWVGSPGRRAGKTWRVTAITPSLICVTRPSRGYARHIRRQKAKGLRK